MEKICIIILNYLNYKDTVECVESIFEMAYKITGIVIVDNNSENESYAILKEKYRNQNRIKVLHAKKNYGFAKGNNIGIAYARKYFHSDYIFVVNNDVIFKQKEFFELLLAAHKPGVGVIGPEIHLKGNYVQPRYKHYVTFWENLLLFLRTIACIKESDTWKKILYAYDLDDKIKKEVLHGCALMFTPDFFEEYNGFYSRTFLYNEEGILYLMCKQKNLEQMYVKEAFLFHKEDQSSEMSFQNNNIIKNKYSLQSHKYLLWWIVKSYF